MDIFDWHYLEHCCRKKYNLSELWQLSVIDNSDSEYLVMLFHKTTPDGKDNVFQAYISNREVLEWNLLKLKKQVESLKGQTIRTLWGPCTVYDVFWDEDNDEWYVHLKEFGVEDFCVKLQLWNSILQ